jgi:hypothetical protein
MSCEERRDAILFWVMGQLEPGPAEELRLHVSGGCAACAAHLAEARELELGLLLAPLPAEPPDSLRRRLVERIAGARAEVPRLAPARRLRARVAAIAAALAVALAAGYRLGGARSGDSTGSAAPADAATLAEELAAAREALEESDAELGGLEASVRDLETRLAEAREQIRLLRAADVQRLALAGSAAQPSARAEMFWQWRDGYYCYLHVEGLRAPPQGRVYVLWIEDDAGERRLVGEFVPDAAGGAELWVRIGGEAGHARAALVTLEPAGAGVPAGEVQLTSG